MLKLFRTHTKKIIWIISIAFIFFGVGTSIITGLSGRKFIGEVNGRKITAAEFEKAYRTVYFSAKVQSLLNQKKDISPTLLENSTFQHIALTKEAAKRHIKVSNNELQKEIVRRFSYNNQFNPRIYENWVKRNTGLSLRNYEEGVRDELKIMKLIKQIKETTKVSDKEVRDFFYRENRQIKVKYVLLDTKKFTDKIQYTNDDLVKFYQSNLDKFKTKRKYQFNYIEFIPDDFSDKVTVSDNEIIDYFNKNRELFPEKQGDKAITAETFKKEISTTIKKEKARQIALTKALTFKNNLLNIANLKETAQKENLNLQTTTFLTIKEIERKIGYALDLEQKFKNVLPKTLFMLNTNKGIYLINVTNVKDPVLIEFTDAKNKIIKLYKEKKAFETGKEIIKTAIQDLKENNLSFESLAKKYNLTFKSTDFFGITDIAINNDSETTKAVFNTLWDKEINHITKAITNKEKDIVVAKLIDIKEPSVEDFEMQKEKIREQITNFKQYIDVQKELSSILKKANIKKYNQNKDISDR